VSPKYPPDVQKLTPEERAVCALMVAGHLNKEIAAILDCGLRTVELRRMTAADKLGLGRTPLIVWAALNREWLPNPDTIGPLPRVAHVKAPPVKIETPAKEVCPPASPRCIRPRRHAAADLREQLREI
jgi:DNA-binding CsgD family transcriptional regulator